MNPITYYPRSISENALCGFKIKGTSEPFAIIERCYEEIFYDVSKLLKLPLHQVTALRLTALIQILEEKIIEYNKRILLLQNHI